MLRVLDPHRALRAWLAGLASLLPLAFAQPGPIGAWQGVLGPDVLNLDIAVTFRMEGAAYAGTIDIPAQGLVGFALGDITFEDPAVAFAMPGIPGDPRFEGTLAGDRIDGTFTQGGQALPFFLERAEAVDLRPQEPKPPFPYLEEEVTFANGGVTLAGTLTLPPGDARVPAVVLISGSGPQDRNEEIVGHKPFLVLADHLTRAGVAVLRYDDRGVGGSTGNDAEATYVDLAGDVGAAIDLLKAHARVDPGAIGLLGHSQGGYLAPVVATERDDVAFAILMAGPAVDGFSVLVVQNERIIERGLRSMTPPASEETIAAAVADQLAFLSELHDLLAADDVAGAGALIRTRIETQFAQAPEDQRPPADQMELFIAAQVEGSTNTVFRSFVFFDPQPYLERLTVPTLAFFGTLDVQVDAEQNEGPMRAALAAAGNEDATVVTFAGLNHLMQPATTGLIDEYGAIPTTIDPVVLDTVTDWITARFGPN